MVGFFKRICIFILGMIFGVISLVAALVYAGVRFYKTTTLDDLGVTQSQVDLGDLNGATIEEIISLVVSAAQSPQSYTFADLEENYGVNVNGILQSFGLDVNSLHPDDLTAIKNIAPFTVLSGEGINGLLNSTNLGVVLAMIPKKDGVFPIFSAGAREQLREYTIGDLLSSDANGTMGIMNIITSYPIGSILSSMYTETYDEETETYNYLSNKNALYDALGYLTISSFTNMGEDIGYALNEGELTKLGEIKLNEIIVIEQGSAITDAIFDITFANLFVKDGNSYVLDFTAQLNDIKVGTLMGMTKCDENCTLEHSHQSGWYDASGNIITNDNISNELMLNLYDETIATLTSGDFNINSIVTDIYFGKALGYTIGSNNGYCLVDCTEEHSHEFYWVDGDNKYVGEMNNVIANVSLQECMESGININDMFAPIRIGDIMGMTYCDGTTCLIANESHVHEEGWYDNDGVKVSTDSISDEIMTGLYDITFEEFSNGEVDLAKLTDGICFGKALGYSVENKAGYCNSDCSETHSHKFYWVDSENKFVGELYNAISNISLKDAMEGKADINSAINPVKLGSIMGKEFKDGSWYNEDGTLVSSGSISDEIMLSLYDVTFEEFSNGEVDLSDLSDGIYFGKALGFKVDSNNHLGYCESDCSETHSHKFYWVDNENKFVGELNNAIANIPLVDAMDGKANVNDAISTVRLGSIMGMTYCDGENCLVDNNAHVHQIGWYDGNGNLVVKDSIGNEIMLKIYDMTFDEFSNGGINLSKLSEGIYFGKALGLIIDETYHADYCQIDCSETHSHRFYWVDKNGNFAGELDNEIANINLVDAMDGKVDIDKTISNVKLGSIMGKEFKNGNWYDKNGNAINYEELGGGDKILYKLYNNKISEFTEGNFDITLAIGDMYVGEVMGYKGSVGAWLKPNGTDYVNASAMEMVVADIIMEDMLQGKVDIRAKIDELTLSEVIDVGDSAILKLLKDKQIKNLSTEIDKLNVGEIMNYVKCTNDSACSLNSVSGHVHDGGWYEQDGTKVTGLYSALSKYSIGELFNGTAKIDELKIGEIIDTEGSPILNLLKDESLNTISDATNKLLLGEVMGYDRKNASGFCLVNCSENHSHKYYWEKDGSPISGLNGKIANYTIEDVSNGKLGGTDFINTLTVGDVITTNTGMFNIMEIEAFTADGVSYGAVNSTDDVPVNEISARLTQGVKTATYSELKNAGIAILSDVNEEKVNIFYEAKGITNWKETKTIDQIMSDIIDTALNPLG